MLPLSSPNATQWVGIASFACAGATCALAARKAGRDQAAWWAIALLLAASAVECWCGARHDAHAAIDAALERHGAYAGRALWQGALIAMVLAMAVGAGVWSGRRRWAHRRTPAAVRWTLALAALFAVETVSLHAVDAVVYRPAGPWLLIGWLWLAIGLGLLACSLALLRERRAQPA